MPESFFNELCLDGTRWDYSILKNCAETVSAMKKSGFTVCRISNGQYLGALNRIKSISGFSKIHENLFYSVFKTPYETSEIRDNQISAFLNEEYSYNGVDTPAGLSWAAVTDGVSFSLLTDPVWDNPFISLNCREGSVPVKHASKKEHINVWKSLIGPVELLCSSQSPEAKKFHVRDDHGNDVLKAFWERVRNSPYVEECVNSLEWQPHCRRFATVKPNNSIDLVLIWEDKGLGINVKTTGRTFRETEKIAHILEKEYGF